MPEDIDTPQPTPYMALEDQFKRLRDERDAWQATAQQSQHNADFYRCLLKQCAVILGDKCRTCVDGSMVAEDDFLALRVPEVLRELEDSYCVAMTDLKRTQQQLAHYTKPQDPQS